MYTVLGVAWEKYHLPTTIPYLPQVHNPHPSPLSDPSHHVPHNPIAPPLNPIAPFSHPTHNPSPTTTPPYKR